MLPVAILGSGNIGTDLMYKLRNSPVLNPVAMVGIDPESDGLARAKSLGLDTSHEGIEWLLARAADIKLVFEATSAHIHARHAPLLRDAELIAVDLTPASIGPCVVPPVNLSERLAEPNLNLATCGAQATVPIVAAVTRVCPVSYAEIVSAVASRSAGPGTRQNIDEFTRSTANALVEIGGAQKGKAIIILNPADPPIIMRNTVYCALSHRVNPNAVTASIEEMVSEVSQYVPGYRLKSTPVFDEGSFVTPAGLTSARVIVFLEVEGAGDYLPKYAGNLDIMTAAAVRLAESLATEKLGTKALA